MHPILQIVLFAIAILVCLIGILKPEKLLYFNYRWRLKGEKEYTAAYLNSVKIVSGVIAVVCFVGIIYAVIDLITLY